MTNEQKIPQGEEGGAGAPVQAPALVPAPGQEVHAAAVAEVHENGEELPAAEPEKDKKKKKEKEPEKKKAPKIPRQTAKRKKTEQASDDEDEKTDEGGNMFYRNIYEKAISIENTSCMHMSIERIILYCSRFTLLT